MGANRSSTLVFRRIAFLFFDMMVFYSELRPRLSWCYAARWAWLCHAHLSAFINSERKFNCLTNCWFSLLLLFLPMEPLREVISLMRREERFERLLAISFVDCIMVAKNSIDNNGNNNIKKQMITNVKLVLFEKLGGRKL